MNIVKAIQSALQHYNSGDLQQAKHFCEKILKDQPDNAEVLHFLGIICAQLKNYDPAIQYLERSLQFNTTNADAYLALGMSFQHKGIIDKAIACYQKTIEMKPDCAEAYNNMGDAFKEKGALNEAIHSYQKAVQINPDFSETYNKLGNAFQVKGKPDEAEMYYRRAIQIQPNDIGPYQNLLFVMNYNPVNDAGSIFSEHVQFAKRFAEPLYSSSPYHVKNRAPYRRLKIGYVSPDFKKHSVAYFIEPVLTAHSRNQFDILCYSNVKTEDEVTKRLQGYVNQWRNITELSDEKAAELIRKDGIDILVDLAGHTTNNRIFIFVRKPAPLQVSWIGYPATTGLSAIDYKIVDRYTDPPGITEQFYTEKLLRLPDCFLCYLPDKDSPEVSLLPALTSGHITFGSFNNFAKVSPEVITLWSEILKAVPYSHLILKAHNLSFRSTRDYAMKMFSLNGISADRIELLSFDPSTRGHLLAYNRIDIGLDTFPYNGTTTTCEALWMGVPVITLAGNTHASRVGLSLLSNIGLHELIARTPDEYLTKAVNLANDLKRLHSLRERLRDMMLHSPLTNAKRFVSNLEKCYHTMWENWCKTAY